MQRQSPSTARSRAHGNERAEMRTSGPSVHRSGSGARIECTYPACRDAPANQRGQRRRDRLRSCASESLLKCATELRLKAAKDSTLPSTMTHHRQAKPIRSQPEQRKERLQTANGWTTDRGEERSTLDHTAARKGIARCTEHPPLIPALARRTCLRLWGRAAHAPTASTQQLESGLAA